MPTFALQIRSLRETLGLSQPEFAKELGLACLERINSARSTIAHWEGGDRGPRARNYLALAKLARMRGQTSFAQIFELLGQVKAPGERERKEVPPEASLKAAMMLAATGDPESRHLLALSKIGKPAYWSQVRELIDKRLGSLIEEELRSPGNHLLSNVLAPLLDEVRQVEKLTTAREELKKGTVR